MSDAIHTIDPKSWVQNFGDYLYNIAFYKVSDGELAEDLVQDTFLAALKAKDKFQAKSSEKTWLTSILNNKIIDHYRAKKSSQDIDTYLTSTEDKFTDSFFEPSENDNLHWKDENRSSTWNTDDMNLLDNESFYTIFIACIDKLPSKLAEIIRFKFIDNSTSEDICKTVGISSANYFVIIHRSKILLRECLDINWFSHEKN
jgi:RNA polymerase sigma-70 factor (TIGR02943 family)